ncbi:hypothetical protein E1287_29735 [Actinomadura sp. KC06]|uniref:hypothetical protein n=1 Tax=Actinomadura sp. KC06 TaxID=2530369 RepID=UPI00104AFC5D|nr:hypothetical protein [Actinomadura sp. KC06]TDD30159.1 hypothetical protein E1287_29735 [Actinomadura sp. KC06]
MTEMVDDVIARWRDSLTSENIGDERIDGAAQGTIARLSDGDSFQVISALGLLAGVKAEVGGLAGISGDDSFEAVGIASQMGIEASQLVPADADATLVTPPDSSIPTLIFRGAARDDPSRLDSALTGAIRDSRSQLSDQLDLAGSLDARPWYCAWICALCAAAILDGVPFDEIPACAGCLVCIRLNPPQ